MKKKTRFIAAVLAFVLTLALLPGAAFAADESAAIHVGAGGIADPAGTPSSFIYYGATPIKWWVLDEDRNTNRESGGMVLLSQYLYGSRLTYGPTSVAWQGSAAQAWCQDFARTNFTTEEAAAIQITSKTDSATYQYGQKWEKNALVSDKLFFLSAEELAGYVGQNSNILKATHADGWTETLFWWLRSPYWLSGNRIGGVYTGNGYIYYFNVDSTQRAFSRPAFNLDLGSVLFTSAAAGGKSGAGMEGGLAAVHTTATNEWKITLLDKNRSGFDVSNVVWGNDSVTFDYENAMTGTNEYISAAIVDEGEVIYYGRLRQLDGATYGGDGSLTIAFPGGVTLDDDTTLSVFNE